MEGSNKAPSSLPPGSKLPARAAFLPYQTRLLERTSSLNRSGSVSSRHAPQSSLSILSSNGTGSGPSSSSTPARPTHRVGQSLDMSTIRGKWEERTREAAESDGFIESPSPVKEAFKERSTNVSIASSPSTTGSSIDAVKNKWEQRSREAALESSSPTKETFKPGITSSYSSHSPALDHAPSRGRAYSDLQRTPTYLKRQTMPAPIIASPLSPNTTGISVEVDTPNSFTPTRIHLPSSRPLSRDLGSSSVPSIGSRLHDSNSASLSSSRDTTPKSTAQTPFLSFHARSLDKDLPATPTARSPLAESHPQPSPLRRRPTSSQGFYSSSSSISDRTSTSTISSNASSSSRFSHEQPTTPISPITPSTPTNPNSVMSPPAYRSSYLANKVKKTDSYRDTLGLGGGRPSTKLGRHLPRIASGDGEDHMDGPKPDSPPLRREDLAGRRKKRLARLSEVAFNETNLQNSFSDQGLVGVSSPDQNAVAGLPGRISLKAPSAAEKLVPSARLLGTNWADKQRHLIQAYEYLCHVGEAQQWIEGCLGEELGFGVVEMEEGLRNGVVLAKLVRIFDGEEAVRRIYQAPKLDFRHSDNINIFFNFVRKEGLPEGFIFELTDLYNKKNLPKVIYCIHALSHLLSRRGRAERIGNLLGRLEFSDDQLQRTQKGLKESGIAMPNFGNVGRELAKEINEEPEVEVETEEERRDRLLLENESSIIQLQARCRGMLLRRSHKALQARIKLSARHITKFQTHCLGALLRRQLHARRQVQTRLQPWAVALQAAARGVLVRRRWKAQLRRIKACAPQVKKLQAQIRGVLQRRRFAMLKAALQKMKFSVTKLQAVARAHVSRHERSELKKTFFRPQISFSIVGLQAMARGNLLRRKHLALLKALKRRERSFIALQAQCRGILLRRRMRAQMAKLKNVTDIVINIQAAVRTYLARKRLLGLIRGLRKVTPFIVAIQAQARANLQRQEHKSLTKALIQVHTAKSVHSLQALARASLVRKKHEQLNKKLDVVTPDVVQFQAACQGYLVRQEYNAWRDHLNRSQDVATFLQALLRGVMQRRTYQARLEYYRANINKVVKIQSLFRAKETREQYRQLTLGKNVTIGTIKNFVHLLDDSEADFQEELKVERLRKRVVESIRANQSLETDVNSLDIKIALVVHNAKTFEELFKTRGSHGTVTAASRASRVSLLAAHEDPFSGSHLVDHDTRRKLELYQQLFYLLQSRAEYFTRLFTQVSADDVAEAKRQFVERVVLTVFGYGQDHREDYLLLKLFQLAIRDQIAAASSPEEVKNGHPMYINIAFPYLRPKQATYARETLQAIIKDVVESDDLDLEVNPRTIYRDRIDQEEMRTGIFGRQSKEVSYMDAIEDLQTRPIYIRHLQTLRWWVEQFVAVITQSTKRMPFGIRYIARETLTWLRLKFPDAPEELHIQCIGRLIYNKYINPVIMIPETFDVVPKGMSVQARKNLNRISEVLAQIASGVPFDNDSPDHIPINDYVNKAIKEMSAWFLEVANVPDAETQYHAHEFMDATVQPKPIYISPNEIYSLHTMLLRHQNQLAGPDDILRVILSELGGVPHLNNEEFKDVRDTAITLELTNRFADVRDPQAEEKTRWVQAKRGVLAILRVQPAQDLLESLMRPVTEEDELLWEDILEAEMENELKQMPRRQPSAAAPDSAYRLEDIRSLKFAAVKVLAIDNLLELEKQGKITRNDGFQGILNAIAGDVRSKHRKRIQRQLEMQSMSEALRQLAERKKYFLEQIESYNKYVESAMSTMQRGKGKKRWVIPFTKQYFHLRELQRSGQEPQYGSFIYTAKYLYEKSILLSIDSYSPRQFDKLQITMSSNTAGVFTLVLGSTMLGGVAARIAKEDIRMEDLLQAKYENKPSLSILGGKVKVNFELFLYQINKKFYS